jgi:hypothetical protein
MEHTAKVKSQKAKGLANEGTLMPTLLTFAF